MKGKNPKVIKIGEKLEKKLADIIEQEKKRGRIKTSWREAGEILSVRIDFAGRLKQVT